MSFEDKKDIMFRKIISIYDDAEALVDEIAAMSDRDKVNNFAQIKPLLQIVSDSTGIIVDKYLPILRSGVANGAEYAEIEKRVLKIMSSISSMVESISQNL